MADVSIHSGIVDGAATVGMTIKDRGLPVCDVTFDLIGARSIAMDLLAAAAAADRLVKARPGRHPASN